MVATNDDAESLTDAVSNFGTAYAATQESLRSTTANIAAMQGQIQMLCQVIGVGQPSPAIQYQQQHPRCPRGGRGCSQQHGGNGHNCRNHGGGGGNFGGGGGSKRNGGSGYNGGGNGHNSGATAAATAAATQATSPRPDPPPHW